MYKVFLSSTARDLANYREAVFRDIRRMDEFHCVRMEDFGARDSIASDFCRQKVAECDVVVLILGLCYGSSPTGSEDSYTLQEYRAAMDTKRSRLAFMSPDDHFYPGFYRETDDLWQKQQAFRKQVAQERILDKFTTPDELASRVVSALSNWARERSTSSATQEIDSLVSFKAKVKGSGAIAQGSGATAAGAGGIAIGSVHGPVTMVNENLAAESEEHYLHTLIKQCDPLDLTPIDEAYPQPGKPGEASSVSVSEVFTTLYLARLTRSPTQEIATVIRKQGEHSPHQKTGVEEERLPIQAVEAVAAVPRLVILGQPGGGKSTLVNYIATQLARRRLKELAAKDTLLGWREEEKPLPVRIILRRFAAWIPPDKSHGTAGLVWDYLENQLQQGGCKEVFPHLKQQLTDEGGIIFFDGLDEVRETDEETRRSLITEAISEFAAPLKKCRVLVTCREYAYKRGDAWHLPEADFPVVELDLFKDEQIAHFTQTWYQVVGPQKGWDEKKCQDEARNLRQAIQDWPHLQELAQYPLLLTLMAQVHGRDGYLPKDRADLYERAVNLLLAHWENRIVRDIHGSRKVEPGLVMQLGVRTDKLRSALERVAFAAHERQEQEQARSERAANIPKEELREELRAELESLDKAEQVIAYIQERAELLQARDNRTYAFPHRTFQEYLTATHILKQSEFDTMLRDRVRRDLTWWREVFLLAAGASGSTPRIISDLVDCLVSKGPEQEGTVSPDKAQQVQVTAQSLVETDFAEHVRKERINEPGRFSTTYERIQKWLIAAVRSARTLAAGERAACGDTLARLGDPRFRPETWYLPDEPLLGFVEIPNGPFLMGSNKKRDSEAYDDELKQHKVTLPTYYIARYPVIVAQFQSFVSKSGYKPEDPESLEGLTNHPVVNVTWYDALAYCKWLTEQLRSWEGTPEPLASLLNKQGWHVTLPSEAQWEKAARGSDGRIYPWGNESNSNLANYFDAGILTTSAVGCFPGGASPYGCEEISGNVLEWTRSLWGEYPYPSEGKERAQREDLSARDSRVLRGGAFNLNAYDVRCAFRNGYGPDYRSRSLGFRVVVSPFFSER